MRTRLFDCEYEAEELCNKTDTSSIESLNERNSDCFRNENLAVIGHELFLRLVPIISCYDILGMLHQLIPFLKEYVKSHCVENVTLGYYQKLISSITKSNSYIDIYYNQKLLAFSIFMAQEMSEFIKVF
jgi:hypothetical protein